MQVQADTYTVSVIMPTYNRAGLIMETIDSIQSQTYQNWELIIVDDGSEDNTGEKIAGIKDERIQFHRAGRIGIGGKVKNIGLQKAKGELIAFMDSDDLWAPTKLEKQVVALQQYPEAGFSLTGGYNFRVPDQPLEYFYKQTEGVKYGNMFNSFFESQLPGFTQALMVRKECFAVTGFFKEEKSFSDLDFIVNLALHFKAVILYEPLLYRRLHAISYINSTWKKSYQEGIEIIQFYKNKKLVTSKMADKALFTAYINFGEDCLLHKERIGAIRNFFTAWKNKPFSIIPFKKVGKAIIHYFTN
ncbi:glycosyltransferase family 2 protein [Terrimonas pollutisoli]|uniref:glycosyltransferase family 2 protein n=1 Tax=Terrimonas pollutisoli TaxID=3034147 RepID=UPI0023EADA51|nr:glycosyltransferase family 2 protein [Terrimonas sp. H1YJ31]